jgi:hypothetical protein
MKYKFLVHNRIFANTTLSPKTHCFTPRFRRKRYVPLRFFAENRVIPLLLWMCFRLPKAHSLTPRFCQQLLVYLRTFAENAKFDSPFLPKTLKTIRKRTVTKTTQNFIPRFRRQRSVMLRAFGEIGEWSKISNIWANFKKLFENVDGTAFCVWKM